MRYDYSDVGEGAVVAVGEMVRHPTYGKGTVEELAEEFGLAKAIVRFQEFGLRKVPVRHLSAG